MIKNYRKNALSPYNNILSFKNVTREYHRSIYICINKKHKFLSN